MPKTACPLATEYPAVGFAPQFRPSKSLGEFLKAWNALGDRQMTDLGWWFPAGPLTGAKNGKAAHSPALTSP